MNCKKFIFSTLAVIFVLTAAAENLIFNGSFEEGQPGASMILPGWVRRTASGSYGYHQIASAAAADGQRSAHIAIPESAPKNSGYFTTARSFKLKPGKKYRLTLSVKCPQGQASVFLIPYNSQKRPVSYSQYGKLNIANSNDWQKVELNYQVPTVDPAGYTGKLQLTLQGSGEAWFDDVVLQESGTTSAAAAPAAAAVPAGKPTQFAAAGVNLLKNGSFEEGKPGASQILPGWVRRTAGNAFNFHSIDSANSSDGKRSARIAIPADAPAKSTGYVAQHSIKLDKGKCYKLSFKARCPQGQASATVILYDHKKHYMGFGGVRKVTVKNSNEWQYCELEYFTPDRNAQGYQVSLQLELTGHGEVWFDDVKLEEFTPAVVKTEFYPSTLNYERKLVGISGEPTPLIFYFFATGKRSNYTLELEVPTEFKLVFASVVYAVNTPQVPIKPIPGAPENYQRYQLQLPDDIVLPMSRFAADLFSGLALLFEGDPGKYGTLKWQLGQAGKKLDGGTIQLQMLPATDYKLPQYPTIYSWYEPFLNYVRDPEILQRYLQKLLRSGITGASISESSETAVFNAANFTNQRGFWQQAPGNCLTGLLKNQTIAQRIDRMAKNMSKWKNAVLSWNFEPDLRDYYHMCDQCLAEFKAYAKLPENVTFADGYAAEKAYPELYLEFRSSQQQQLMQQFTAICHRNNIRSALNGYRVSRNTDMLDLKRRMGGVREIVPHIDIYQAQIYALPENLWLWLQDMQKFHPGTVITYTTDERSKGGTFPYSLITPELIECETLIAGIQRVKNLIFFVGVFTMDGSQYIALRRALHRIAQREYMLNGQAQDIQSAGAPEVHWRQFQRDGKTLLAAVNCDENRKLWSAVPLPDNLQPIDPERKIAIQRDNQGRLAVNLNAMEVRFFELIAPDQASCLPQEPAGQPLHKTQEGELCKQGDWLVSEDANGMISIKFNRRQLGQISRHDGAVFYPGEKFTPGKNCFFRDLFHQPREAAWAPDCRREYDLVKIVPQKDTLTITLQRNLVHRELKDLFLSKTYQFTANQPVHCTVKVENKSSQSKKIAYWQHNRPLFAIDAVTFTAGKQQLTITSSSPVNNYLPANGVKTLTAADKYQFAFSLVPDKFYFWKTPQEPASAEIMFPAVTLPPGGCWQLTSKINFPSK